MSAAAAATPPRDPGASAPLRVLVLGGGAREHALAWRLAGEAGVAEVIAAPGNDAIARVPGVRCVPVRATHGLEVASLAQRERADLVVVGPEAPLAAGVADALRAAGVATFGPSAAAARIESSKAFCREVAEAAGIRMARGRSFSDVDAAAAFARELAASGGGVVVKADGLMAGKGVVVCDDGADAVRAIEALAATARAGATAGTGGAGHEAVGEMTVVVEERLTGPEASVIALCDGTRAVALPAARDHKRIGDGDTGPNTGGMGAYAPLPDLPAEAVAAIVRDFHLPALRVLAERGTPFVGALYAGLMLTPDGPALLEFNARFGDPETQVLLPIVMPSLACLMHAAALGDLGAAAADARIDGMPGGGIFGADDAAAVGIVLASDGYPEAPVAGDVITGLDEAEAAGALVFHAGTERTPDGAWRTRGGRAVTVVGLGPDLGAARDAAERAAAHVSFRGMRRRHDIGAVLPPSAAAATTAAPTEPTAASPALAGGAA